MERKVAFCVPHRALRRDAGSAPFRRLAELVGFGDRGARAAGLGPCSIPASNSRCSQREPHWISGEDEKGDIVLTQAGRIYYWGNELGRRGALDVLCGLRRGPPRRRRGRS